MARPRKTGLDYFPFDVDFFTDEKVVCIGGEFGVKGELTIIRLLCAIYRNGYFIQWNDSLKYKLRREMDGVSAGLLEEIVQRLVERNFFDEDLFNTASVLTSEGIQRRYFEATKFRQRDQTLPYLLAIPRENYVKTGISQLETPVSQGLSTQIKRNKIKISSDEDTKRTPAAPPYVEEKFLKDFFDGDGTDAGGERMKALECLRESLGIPDMGTMKRLAGEVTADWKLRKHVPRDWSDASSHLISALRKKCRAESCSPAKASGKPEPSGQKAPAVSDLDRQESERRERYEEMVRKSVRPSDYIRSLGYDPAKVSMAQVCNPEWCRLNPPENAFSAERK